MSLRTALWALAAYFTPEPAWRWAAISLLGHRTLWGQVTDPERPTMRVRAFASDGSFTSHVFGRAALYGVDELDEAAVRRLYVEEHTRAVSGRTCESFEAHPVEPSLCATCATTEEAHQKRAAREALDRVRAAVRAALREALGTQLVDVTGAGWQPGAAVVLHARIWDESEDGTRPLNAEEWERALAAGVAMGPFREPSDTPFGVADEDEDAPASGGWMP